MATALEEHQSNAAMIAPDLVLGDGTALSGDVDMHLHQPLNAVELAMLDADLGQSSGPLSHLVQSPSLSDDEWIALHFRLPGPDEFASGNHPHEDLPFFRTTPVSVDNDDVDRNSTVRDSNTSPLPVFPEAKMRYPSPDHINSPSFALHCKAATLKQPRKRRTACKQTSAKRTLDRRQTSALKAKQAALPSLENEPDSCDDDLSPADHIGHIAAQACMLLGDDAPSYGFFAKLIAAYTPDVAARLSGNRPQLTVHAVGERVRRLQIKRGFAALEHLLKDRLGSGIVRRQVLLQEALNEIEDLTAEHEQLVFELDHQRAMMGMAKRDCNCLGM